MIISDIGIQFIKDFESCKLQSYDDATEKIVYGGDTWEGTLTIGWGHVEGVYAGQVITQEQADEMLRIDMEVYSNEVQEVINEGTMQFEVTQNMFDMLTSFDYNCGQGSLRTLCKGRDKATVADKMLLYNKSNGQVMGGLTRRRQAEREIFLNDMIVLNPTQKNSTNSEIQRLQHELNIQGFTDSNGNTLIEDGVSGTLTISACPLVHRGAFGNITQWVQLRVGSNPDKDFGEKTEKDVKSFQDTNKLIPDGMVGKQTWSKFFEIMEG